MSQRHRQSLFIVTALAEDLFHIMQEIAFTENHQRIMQENFRIAARNDKLVSAADQQDQCPRRQSELGQALSDERNGAPLKPRQGQRP